MSIQGQQSKEKQEFMGMLVQTCSSLVPIPLMCGRKPDLVQLVWPHIYYYWDLPFVTKAMKPSDISRSVLCPFAGNGHWLSYTSQNIMRGKGKLFNFKPVFVRLIFFQRNRISRVCACACACVCV